MATLKAAVIPSLIYGTAWKKDQTRTLVKQALLTGFRGVDTAAQPKHYQEDLVGEGLRDAMKEGGLKREDLYVRMLRVLIIMIVSAYNRVRSRRSSLPSMAKIVLGCLTTQRRV